MKKAPTNKITATPPNTNIESYAVQQNELIHAVNYYKKAIQTGERETDYGYYQLGQAYKLLNKFDERGSGNKIQLQKLSESVWDDSLAEMVVGDILETGHAEVRAASGLAGR